MVHNIYSLVGSCCSTTQSRHRRPTKTSDVHRQHHISTSSRLDSALSVSRGSCSAYGTHIKQLYFATTLNLTNNLNVLLSCCVCYKSVYKNLWR